MQMIKKVVCFPVTKWHLYGMLSYLIETYGEDKLQTFDIEVYAIKHSENGYLLSPGDILYKNISFHYEDELVSDRRKLFRIPFCFGSKKRANYQIILIFANRILVRKMFSYLVKLNFNDKKLQVILVDDGIGSYLSKKVWKRCAKAESGFYLKSQIKVFLADIIKSSVNAIEWHMLTIEEGHLRKLHTVGYLTAIKRDVEGSFGQQLREFREQYKDKPVAFFVTQPWSETGQILEEKEMKIISEIVAKLSEKYIVIVKPHPRENTMKYNFENVVVLGGNYPAEFYLCALKKKDVVIGFNSTALINAALVFDLDTYTISDKVTGSGRNNMMEVACGEFLKLTKGTISVYNSAEC